MFGFLEKNLKMFTTENGDQLIFPFGDEATGAAIWTLQFFLYFF